MKTTENLYMRIGDELIEQIIDEFYRRAFNDVIIGHFFWGKDHSMLVEKQISFTKAMLGKTTSAYEGQPLKKVHSGLNIRRPHFDRRKMILSETMDDFNLDRHLKKSWLDLEDKLRKLILS